MLFLVTGTVVYTEYYESGSKETIEIRIVEADSENEAEEKFSDHFESKSSEYSHYYRTRYVKAHSVIK